MIVRVRKVCERRLTTREIKGMYGNRPGTQIIYFACRGEVIALCVNRRLTGLATGRHVIEIVETHRVSMNKQMVALSMGRMPQLKETETKRLEVIAINESTVGIAAVMYVCQTI